MSMSTLPDDCLREIFLKLPILERIKIRKVCRKWRRVSDDCWREARVLSIKGPKFGQNTHRNIVGNSRVIEITCVSRRVALTFVKRCTPYLTKFTSELIGTKFSVLRPLQRCRNIEELRIDAFKEERHLDNLLLVNPKIKKFSVDVYPGTSLRNLSTDILEDLEIAMWLPSWNTVEGKVLASEVKQIIHRCHSLKRLRIASVPDRKCMELIAAKRTVEYLTIVDDGGYRLGDELSNYLRMDNLRGMSLGAHVSQPFTDACIKNLITYCGNLEIVILSNCMNVTDRGLQALEVLPNLRILSLSIAIRITNVCLPVFSKLESLRIHLAKIEDSSVIALLRNSPQLQRLTLTATFNTMKCVNIATEEVMKRTNGVPLEIYFDGIERFHGPLPALLRINKFDVKI